MSKDKTRVTSTHTSSLVRKLYKAEQLLAVVVDKETSDEDVYPVGRSVYDLHNNVRAATSTAENPLAAYRATMAPLIEARVKELKALVDLMIENFEAAGVKYEYAPNVGVIQYQSWYEKTESADEEEY